MTRLLFPLISILFSSLIGYSQKGDSLNSDWFEQINANIAQLEYHISFVQSKNKYQSPNRNHNIRSYYSPGLWELHNRVDSVGHNWGIAIQLLGIYANDNPLVKQGLSSTISSEKYSKENQIEFDNNKYIEQYVNSEEGVRQNFIIKEAPIGTNNIQISFKLEGMTAKKRPSGELVFSKNNEEMLTYSELKVWDKEGKEIQSEIKLIDNTHWSIVVQTSNAVYPITVDPIIRNKRPMDADVILESDKSYKYMGYSVSGAGDVNGDGFSDVIVGAYTYDNGETNEGAAFVYHGSSNGLSTTASNVLEANQPYAYMGFSVSGAGDINGDGYDDIIVGAKNYGNGEQSEGAAFVYHGTANGVFTIAAKVLESNQLNAQLGTSVSAAGDVNKDGFADIIIGAPYYDNGETNEGAAFIYYGSSAGLSTTFSSIVESNQAGANLGNSVANAGDINNDGYDDIVVGAWKYNDGQTNEGAAYVYLGSASGLVTTSKQILESNQADANMGVSVSTAGDVNHDGYDDIIVGAPNYDNGESDEGAVFIFHGSSGGLISTPQIILESNQELAQMGNSVSCAGDVNDDGFSDIIIGVVSFDNNQRDAGAAFVYHGSENGLAKMPSCVLESNQAFSYLGASVSGAGDVNGDGFSDVIVGAFQYKTDQDHVGAAFVFHGSHVGLAKNTSSLIETKINGGNLGFSVSGAGDLNKDGYADVIVGAPNYDKGENREGVVFVYHGSKLGLSNTPNSILETNQAGAEFGYSVAGAGDVNGDGYSDVIIGARYYDKDEIDEGAAFVFHGSDSGLSLIPSSLMEYNQASAQMGYSVSGAGDINKDGYSDVIVGAFAFDNGQTDEGGAFVYYGSSNGINTKSATLLEPNLTDVRFGASVSGAGDVNGDGHSDVIVGTPFYSNGEKWEGAAYLYYGSIKGLDTIPNLIIESNTANYRMGWSVSEAGDVNNDGFGDIIVGVFGYQNGQKNEGAAFVYHGSSNGLDTSSKTILESNNIEAYMGSSVSKAGDVNGDGFGDVIVGAFNYTNSESKEGAAYLYFGSSNGLNTTAKSIFESNQSGAHKGCSVSNAGDVDNDGFDDIIVGAYGFSSYIPQKNSNAGAAYVYNGCRDCGVSIERISVKDCYQYVSPKGKLWTKSGIYYDTIVNYNLWDSLLVIKLEIMTVDKVVEVNSKGLSSKEELGTYQWLDCNNNYAPVANETAQLFSPQINGNYAVVVKSQNGCIDTSDCYVFNTSSVVQHNLEFKYSPNPTSGLIRIMISKPIKCEIEVYNSFGQLLIDRTFDAKSILELELPSPAGLYHIRLKGQNGDFYQFKVIKQK